MVSWGKYWGAIGVAELLVIGTLFFLFPEPITSVLGMTLIVIAAGVWLAGWYRERSEPDEHAGHREHPEPRHRSETGERRVRR